MNRRAFTLVELMVVIAVLSLLLAIVLPSMSSVYAMARATICRGHLQRLGEAFSAASSGQAIRERAAGVGSVVSAFPKAMSWPSIPRSTVPEESIYFCPEDEQRNTNIGDLFELLEYECPYGRFPMNTMGGESTFYMARTGEDEKGPYTEFHFQDDYGNGQFQMMNWHGWFDIDGFCRVYHRGVIWIPSRLPDTADFSGAYVITPGRRDGLNTCGDLNAIRWRGNPAFGSQGLLRNHRDQYIELEDWNPGGANYGINSYAHRYAYGSKCIVLVDYKEELIVEVDTPLEVEEILLKSGRHLGKLNYLRGDGSVKTATPLSVSPRLNPLIWNPSELEQD